jgi:hypothetical protein
VPRSRIGSHPQKPARSLRRLDHWASLALMLCLPSYFNALEHDRHGPHHGPCLHRRFARSPIGALIKRLFGRCRG